MIIDCHVHLVHEAARQKGFKLPKGEEPVERTLFASDTIDYELSLSHAEALLESMDKSGIDKSVILGLPWCTSGLCRENNDYIAECAAKYPDKLIPLGIIQPRDQKEALYEIERLTDGHGFKGVKVKPVWQGFRVNDLNIMGPIAEALIRKDALLMVHVDQLINPETHDMPYGIFDLKRNFPELNILGAHLGGLLGLYTHFKRVRDVTGAIWYDTAIPATIKMVEYAADVVPDRITFGTDFPYNIDQTQKTVLDDVKALNLAPGVLEGILWKNANKMLGLGL